ncbi:MAG TPA: hypothetical protein PLA90_16810 [Candidatus Sumerlaeota bacterium]|nr:hypothetical protein [Candidatus Sumerlaeota bacterium]
MKKFSVVLIYAGVPLFVFAAAWGIASFPRLLPRRHTAGKVARTRADLLTLVNELEKYNVDFKSYPPSSLDPATQVVPFDKEPVISTFRSTDGKGRCPEFENRLGGGLARDAFSTPRAGSHFGYYAYPVQDEKRTGKYSGFVLVSRGPDGDFDLTQKDLEGQTSGKEEFWTQFRYDSTNGAVSSGDLIRTGGAVFPQGPCEPENTP